MAIESPATYGDFYWAQQVEANKFFADESEQTVAPYIRSLLADIPLIPEFPDGVRRFIETLSEPPSFAFLPFLSGFALSEAEGFLNIALEPALLSLKRNYGKRFKSTWLTPDEVNTLWSRKKISEGLWDEVIAAAGYEDVLASSLYESQLPYPSIPDLVLYSRYHGDPDNAWSEFQKWFNISPRDWPVWEWLTLQRLTTLQVQTLRRRGLITNAELFKHLAEIGWSASDRPLVSELGWTMPNAMLLVQGDLQQQQSTDRILRDISIADINPKYAQTYYDAILTKPSSSDIVAYQLRKDPSLAGLDTDLRKIGIHPDHFDVYKTLANPIPPVADIITMAVREAFTPAIAARFGQYEDLPTPFVEWVAKKGLTKDWAERYWAAHWSLPSATQGFEMLHRGVINPSDLDMLLRALDVMPFWREKLIGIAYRRLSRVDIRRMYGVGVLTEAEVYEAYIELGYNERDAKRMSDFTVKQILATQSKFTARDVIAAYSKYMITQPEARSLLIDVGVKSENIKFIISTAEYKRTWELTEGRIAAIRNLYKKEVYTPDKARSELLRLDMPAERVDVLMEQWYIDEKDKAPRHWTTAQTLTFIKAGLITEERGHKELRDIGYDAEHINVYMKASK